MNKALIFSLEEVLVRKKPIALTPEEKKIEKMFEKVKSDSEFIIGARKIISNDSVLISTTQNIFDKLYEVREPELFKNIKEKYNNIKIFIATNHVSYIRSFIGESFGLDYLDDFFISSEIKTLKSSIEFYEYILNEHNLISKNVLYLDDSYVNLNPANKIGINVIKVDRNTNLLDSVINWLEKNM